MSDPTIFQMPSSLVTGFKRCGAIELPQIAKFHAEHGNDDAVEALRTAAAATRSL
jgi:hypothetical protein